MARSAVARATCAAGARRDRLSRESVICSPSLNARSGSFCRLDIGHLTTRHVASMADLVPNDPLEHFRVRWGPANVKKMRLSNARAGSTNVEAALSARTGRAVVLQ